MRRTRSIAALLCLAVAATPSAVAQDPERASKAQEHPANHLAGETSPYLLQHSHNPVEWYPWGPEALARAKEEDKPIFLSIGYSACHWCHVMERESFEDEAIAAFLNEHFVCIKVDREERPDVDELYMGAVTRMTGGGGWPLSVFLTPELEPFWGGTYWPPRATARGPGFEEVLGSIQELWVEERERAVQAGRRLLDSLREQHHAAGGGTAPGPKLLERAVEVSAGTFDQRFGGFGQGAFAPKFPRCTQLAFLLRCSAGGGDARALDMARTTLRNMAAGGIHDQLGGGFARYSVDRDWTVPHFERMLYDNAQLAQAYMEAWQATGQPWARAVSEDVLRWVLREMTSSEGGFWSSTDADSEGEEGVYFVWSPDEVRAVCGEDAPVALAWFGLTEAGNFEGANVLTARSTLEAVAKQTGRSPEEVAAAVERSRAALLARRARRVPPHTDDKVLASWNGLMLSALARAAAVYGEEEWLAAARRNADFLLSAMRREEGGLWRTRRAGRSHLPGYLEDHAFVVQGLLDLYEADPDPRWLAEALALHAYVEAHFADAERGGYWSQSDETAGALPLRTSSAEESSLPSDVGVAGTNAARIGLLTGERALLERARSSLERHGEQLVRWPSAFGQLLLLVDLLEGEPAEVYVAGRRDDPRVQRELERLRRQWPPRRVFALIEPGSEERMVALLPAAEGKSMRDGAPTVYVCHEGVCAAPLVLE